MSNTNKVYEIVLHGAIDGGYLYAEKNIASCLTLDDAKAFLKSDAQILDTGLEVWHEACVFERTMGKTCNDDKLVFATSDVNIIVHDACFEYEISQADYEVLEAFADEHNMLVGTLLNLYDRGMSVHEIVATYDD